MRRAFPGILAAVVVVAMITAVWRYIDDEELSVTLVLSDVTGPVSLERTDGPSEAVVGVPLRAEDRVATGPEGRAVLTLGRDTHVRVGPASSVQVIGVDEAGVSLELEDGALRATVRPESGGVRIANQGRAVLATRGEFEVGVSDSVLQIRSIKGTASLSGVDQARLAEGQQATVVDRHADVGPVPEDLLLAVDWPSEGGRTRAQTTILTGITAPWARVRLRGTFGERTVRADQGGRFEVEIPLAEGPNEEVEVEAVDALGHRRAHVGSLQTRDTRGPTFRGGVEYER